MKTSEPQELFFEYLKKKFLSLGFQESIAHTVCQSIEIVKTDGNTVVAECRNSFYRDTIIAAKINDLSIIAKECWGNETKFVLRLQEEAHNHKKRLRQTRRNTTSLFDFADPTSIVNFAKEIAENRENALSLVPKDNVQELSKPSPQFANPVEESVVPKDFSSDEPSPDEITCLNSEFSFDTFVSGESNIAAYSACIQIAQNPGKLTNPVFIYGATGLGKTHLLHSVGNSIRKKYKKWDIIYVTSADYMNEFIASIRRGKQEMFRNKYQKCDVLLIDDIQFLENKESTQLEFFHTFNELCNKRKQIVLTSDKYPKDIPNIEERLKSRFVAGLITAVEPPSFEDRVAIIEQKCKLLSLKISREITLLIAKYAKANVREIQGVLNNLLMTQSMSGKPPTIETTMGLLQKIVRINASSVDIPSIQKAVASNFGLKLPELLSQNRAHKLVLPRHIAMFLSRDILSSPTTTIAEAFGKKDHTTVMHAISRIKDLIEKDASTRAIVHEIKRKLEHGLI